MEIPKAKPIPISLPSNSSQSFHTPLQSFHMFSNSPRREDIYVNRLKDHLVGSQGVHSLLGGAITRDIYLAAEKLESDSRTRRNSEPNITLVEQDVISARELQQPGGFRRNFIHNRNLSLGKPTHFVTNNFMDFLALYGYYGGDVSPEDDEEFQVIDSEANETQPLMGSTHSLRNSSSSVTGTSAQKAFFMIMKAFVGFVPLI